MTGIKRSLGIAFVTQYVELMIGFVTVMIVARLISSTEIGIYSVAAFMMALLHVFRDFGVGKYIIQEDDLTPQKIRSALGVAILLAWLVALLLFACSGLAAAFYHEPRVKNILWVMSLSFAATPIGSVLNGIYRREMLLKKVATVRIGSAVCHAIVSVTLALAGYGAMSMAWANFASIAAFGVIAILLRPSSIPIMPSFRNMRSILSYGSVSSLGSMVMVAGTNSPDVIIGKSISLTATGYFSRANGLIQIFRTLLGNAIVPLVMPYFAQLRRENGDMTAAYHKAVSHLTGIAWPFFAVLCVLALPVTRTLYGPSWDVSVPVARLLTLAGAVSMIAVLASEVMTAYGHNKAVTQLQLVVQPVRVLAVLAASPFGLNGIGWALVATECITVIVTSHLLYRTTGVSLHGVLAATLKSALVALCSAVGPVAVMLFWGNDGHPLLQTLTGGVTALIGWLLGNIWSNHPMREHLGQARVWLQSNARWAK
jgi:O-antigen/teichoic acid export membrane protein